VLNPDGKIASTRWKGDLGSFYFELLMFILNGFRSGFTARARELR